MREAKRCLSASSSLDVRSIGQYDPDACEWSARRVNTTWAGVEDVRKHIGRERRRLHPLIDVLTRQVYR